MENFLKYILVNNRIKLVEMRANDRIKARKMQANDRMKGG